MHTEVANNILQTLYYLRSKFGASSGLKTYFLDISLHCSEANKNISSGKVYTALLNSNNWVNEKKFTIKSPKVDRVPKVDRKKHESLKLTNTKNVYGLIVSPSVRLQADSCSILSTSVCIT